MAPEVTQTAMPAWHCPGKHWATTAPETKDIIMEIMKTQMLEELKNIRNKTFFFLKNKSGMLEIEIPHSIQNHFENEREWWTGFQHLLVNKGKKTKLSSSLKMNFQMQHKTCVLYTESWCVKKAGSEIRVQENCINPKSRTLLRLGCDGRASLDRAVCA